MSVKEVFDIILGLFIVGFYLLLVIAQCVKGMDLFSSLISAAIPTICLMFLIGLIFGGGPEKEEELPDTVPGMYYPDKK